jgi:O-antigen biosynthesis protein
LRESGGTLGFSPAAVVWHHRRNSVHSYWRQQQGYTMAEVLLERKWPERYNSGGHLSWSGRIYGRGRQQTLGGRERIYQGTWGTAPFQVLDQPKLGVVRSLPLLPEWYLIIAGLAMLSSVGLVWTRLRMALPILLLAAAAPLLQAGLGGARASFRTGPRSRLTSLKLWGLTAALHLLYSAARFWGRLRHGLTPWRRHGQRGLSLRRRHTFSTWTEQWQAPEQRLSGLERAVRGAGAPVVRGGPYDGWDLQARGGMLGAVRILTATEEHGAGRQLVRVRSWPKYSSGGVTLIILLAALAVAAAVDHATVAAALFGALAAALALRALHETASAAAAVRSGLERVELDNRPPSPNRRRRTLARCLRRGQVPSREQSS